MRNYKTEGIIIKRSNFSEADRILTILTKHYGKIKVIAKGVRRITSKRGGNVELLNFSDITLHEGKNFDILTEASVKESFAEIKNNLTKIGWAYHLCELIDGLCAERQENRKIFEELIKILNQLNNYSLNPSTTLRVNSAEKNNQGVETYRGTSLQLIIQNFEVFLLHELGFWPVDRPLAPDMIDRVLEDIL